MTAPKMKKSICLSVPKKSANEVKKISTQIGILDKQLEIYNENDQINIPLLRQPREEEIFRVQMATKNFNLAFCSFREKPARNLSLEDVIGEKIPSALIQHVPKALDVVGDIAIVEIPPELAEFKTIIGESILKVHPNIKSVLAKTGAIKGTYRLRQTENLAGEQRTITTHKEFGCSYNIDVAKAYFSPRLSTEHKRVSSMVKSNETVLDLFAGVGPFSILIAKEHSDVHVYAVDLNPDAIAFLKTNIKQNRVENRVFPILGNAREIVKTGLSKSVDRVIMNLPESANEFVDVACDAIKRVGGTIHFYGFLRHPESFENAEKKFSEAVSASGRQVAEFLIAKKIRETAPFECQFVLDVRIL